jgi:hypothetical protein
MIMSDGVERSSSGSGESDDEFALWAGVLIAPAAYFLQLGVAYALVPWVCAGGSQLALHMVTLAALALCAYGGFIAWRNWERVGREYPRDSGDTVSRSRFMAFSGVVLSALFFVAIIAQEIPTWIVDACL